MIYPLLSAHSWGLERQASGREHMNVGPTHSPQSGAPICAEISSRLAWYLTIILLHYYSMIQKVRDFIYLAAQTMAALARLKIIWKDKNIRIKHKIRLMRALVMTIFLYACATWTLTAELQRRIQSLEFRCFRKILGISYKDRVTNEHVRKTIVI